MDFQTTLFADAADEADQARPAGGHLVLDGVERVVLGDGAWVDVRGRFVETGEGWVLRAESSEVVAQPAEPYVY